MQVRGGGLRGINPHRELLSEIAHHLKQEIERLLATRCSLSGCSGRLRQFTCASVLGASGSARANSPAPASLPHFIGSRCHLIILDIDIKRVIEPVPLALLH